MGMGISFIVIVAFPFYIALHKCSVYVCKGEVKKPCLVAWVEPKHFPVMAIVFLAESCVDLGFWCGICLKFMQPYRWSTTYESISSCCVFFFSACLIITPIYLLTVGIFLYYAVKKEN